MMTMWREVRKDAKSLIFWMVGLFTACVVLAAVVGFVDDRVYALLLTTLSGWFGGMASVILVLLTVAFKKDKK